MYRDTGRDTPGHTPIGVSRVPPICPARFIVPSPVPEKSMSKAKRRRNRRRKTRHAVERGERVKPTPETIAKLKPWPMQTLLAQGAEDGGIEADEFEAAIEIVEAFKAITIATGDRHQWSPERIGIVSTADSMSDHDAFLAAVWFEWAKPYGARAAHIAASIEDAEPIGSIVELRTACRRWLKARADLTRPSKPIDMPPDLGLPVTASKSLHLPSMPHALPQSHSSPVQASPGSRAAPARSHAPGYRSR
jgi:hypothetical protein